MMMARVHVTLAALLAFGLTTAAQSPLASAQTAAPLKEPAKKASAPKKKAAPAESKPDQAAAQKQLEAAQKSLDAGKPEQAATQATAVMSLAGIDARTMARALALRGMAYKKQGKPAQAMADLQSALYIKNGLSEPERAAAAQARSEAYREAGLPEPQAIGAPRQSPPQASRVQTASTVRPEEPKPAAPAPAGGNFFTNLFGGGQSQPPAAQPPSAAPPPATTASVPPPAQPAAPAAKTPPARASVAQAAPAPAATAPPVAKAAVTGRYRMQLGPVRTQSEAKTVAERVRKEHAAALAGRNLVIDETVYGNMGTFYIVVIGPYAEAAEPKELCATLRGAKVADCQVLTP